MSNPQAPRLYGLPKIRTAGSPMRPVALFVPILSYKLAKLFDVWFKHITDFHHPFSIKNFVELCELLTPSPLPEAYRLLDFFINQNLSISEVGVTA